MIGNRSNSSRSFRVRCLGAMLLGALAGTANAQWKVINLHPIAADSSVALGVWGDQQVGYLFFSSTGYQPACLWTGSPDTWVNLTPPTSDGAVAYGVSGGQQVGRVHVPGQSLASLWTGSAESWVSLNPDGITSASAYAVFDGVQVGEISIGGVTHAGLWRGTAGSWVDLHPAGAYASTACAVSTDHQGGTVTLSYQGASHAALWSNVRDSWVDLHPAVPYSHTSHVTAMSEDQQVGYMWIGYENVMNKACLWTGSAESWVDLSPAGSSDAYAYGVYHGMQVGVCLMDDGYRASLWRGTAASWVDLSAFIPGDFHGTVAEAVWSDGTNTYIVGHGSNWTTGREEAILWVNGCAADFDNSGFLDIDDYTAFVLAFEAGTQNADFDLSGFVDTDDFDEFVRAFEAGC